LAVEGGVLLLNGRGRIVSVFLFFVLFERRGWGFALIGFGLNFAKAFLNI
jgi:hypothetical protein